MGQMVHLVTSPEFRSAFSGGTSDHSNSTVAAYKVLRGVVSIVNKSL